MYRLVLCAHARILHVHSQTWPSQSVSYKQPTFFSLSTTVKLEISVSSFCLLLGLTTPARSSGASSSTMASRSCMYQDTASDTCVHDLGPRCCHRESTWRQWQHECADGTALGMLQCMQQVSTDIYTCVLTKSIYYLIPVGKCLWARSLQSDDVPGQDSAYAQCTKGGFAAARASVTQWQ